jgi:hypothetical protein
MIWNPKPGMAVRINYKDKSLPYQGYEGEVMAVGRSIKNALVKFHCQTISTNRYVQMFFGRPVIKDLFFYAVIPRGNLRRQ